MKRRITKLVLVIALFTMLSGIVDAVIPISDGFDYPVEIPDGIGFRHGQTPGGNDGWDFLEVDNGVYHPGEDWNKGSGSDDLGLPVYSIANGKVNASDDFGCGWGNIIMIEHTENDRGTSTVWSNYAHLQTRLVSKDEYVHRGQQIGTIGTAYAKSSTGKCDYQYSPHLHFEIRKNYLSPTNWANIQTLQQVQSNYYDPSDFISAHRPQITPLIGDFATDYNYADDNGIFDPRTQIFSLTGGKYQFGETGDLPLVGDWDGNGIDSIGVYRPRTAQFFLDNNNDQIADQTITYGIIGDYPIVGDWNNGKKDNIGVFRRNDPDHQNQAVFYRKDASYSIFGSNADFPITGDWNNDGIDDIGYFRRNDLAHKKNAVFYLKDISSPIEFGNNDHIPITGKPNSNGLTYIGVFSPPSTFIFKSEPVLSVPPIIVPPTTVVPTPVPPIIVPPTTVVPTPIPPVIVPTSPNPTKGTISITSPQTEVNWQSGSIQMVKWDYTGNVGSTVNIDLYKGGVFIKQIATNIPIGNGGSGTYKWTMAKSRPSGTDYLLEITSNLGIVGRSGDFTISDSTSTPPPIPPDVITPPPDVIVPPPIIVPPTTNVVNAYRTIDKTISMAGNEIGITVTVQNDGTNRALSLKESIPSGWSITRMTDDADQFKVNTNEWAWFSITSNAVKTTIYKVTIPLDTSPGTYNIDGYIKTNGVMTTVTGDTTISVTKGDILSYYRGLGINSNILETDDLLKAADDWRNDVIPSGFSLSINTDQLLILADEWRNS